MTTPSAPPTEAREKPDSRITTIKVTPVLTPDQLAHSIKDADAIIMIVYAAGTSPDRLAPVIREGAVQGKALIFLSDNPGDTHGTVKLTYEAGREALRAGAVLLQKVNSGHLDQVYKAVNEAIKKGLRGQALSQYIYNQFAFGEGERIPKAEWETAEGVAEMRQLFEATLRRIGLKPADIQRWLDKIFPPDLVLERSEVR